VDEQKLSIDFFEQFCENGGLNRGLMKVANEGGRAHGLLNVTSTDFFSLRMSLPSISEQTAIAEVLNTADNEIAIHSKTLDALRLQKRGLMQQLLTGKTRVKI
jgi:type I restriction enzyme S subunit